MATVVIALTGEPGAGKSTAARWFAEAGAVLLDADDVVRNLWEGTELKSAARTRWGDEVFLPDGSIDKKAVSARVFSNDDEYNWLCKVTHPIVMDKIKSHLPKNGIAVAEIPMLFEVGKPDWVDKVLFMTASAKTRASRNAFRGLDAKELSRREKFFLPVEKRIAMSDWVVCNDGTISNLTHQLEKIWSEVMILLEKRSTF